MLAARTSEALFRDPPQRTAIVLRFAFAAAIASHGVLPTTIASLGSKVSGFLKGGEEAVRLRLRLLDVVG